MSELHADPPDNFEMNQLHVKLLSLPGTYKKTESIVLKELAHKEFARQLNVSVLRIQDVNLLYDDFNLYISATLLDRPPAPGK